MSSPPNFLPSKPGIIIDLKERYLTRNYTAYINAKKQAELVNSTNIAKVEIQGHNRLPNPNNDSNNNNNTSNIITTGFEGLSQVCCIPQDIQLATGSKYVMETVNSEAAIYTKKGSLIKKLGLESLFNLPSRESTYSHSITDPVLLFDTSTNNSTNNRWFASISDVTTHSIRIAVSESNDPTDVWGKVSTLCTWQ